MAAPWATYPRHSSLSCATLPCQVNPWGSWICPALRRAGFGGCRAGGCDKRRPRKRPGSPAPGRAEAAEAAQGDLLPLGASFLFSQLEILCPGVMGEGNPKLGVLLHHVSTNRGTKGSNPWQGCGTTAGLQVCVKAWMQRPSLTRAGHHTHTRLEMFDFRGRYILKTLLF